MQQQNILPYLDHSAISIEQLQKGSLRAHAAFCSVAFPSLIRQVKALIEDDREAPIMTGHMFIKCWIACSRLNNIMELFTFLDQTARNHCQLYKENKGPADAPMKLIYQEIFAPGIRQGQSREELFAKIEKMDEKSLSIARMIFNFRYNRNYTHQKIQMVTGITIQEVLEYDRQAMQLLYLVLTSQSPR